MLVQLRILVLFLHFWQCISSCGTLSLTSPCQGVISWSDNIWLPDGTFCQDPIETELNATWGYLGFLSPECRSLVAFKICSDFYPACSPSSQPIKTCVDVCNAITSATDLCKDDQAILTNLSVSAGTTLIIPAAIPFKGKNLISPIINCTGLPSPPDCSSYPTTSYNPALTLDRCEPYNGTVCAGIFPGKIFMAQGHDQAYYEAVLQASSGILAVVEGECALALPPWACSKAFANCDEKPYSRTTNQNFDYEPPLPSYACNSYCQTYSAVCVSIFGLSPLLIPTCNATDGEIDSCGSTLWEGAARWPETANVYTAGADGKDISVSCTSTLGQSGLTGSCPAPLVLPVNPYVQRIFPGAACALPCPPYWHFPAETWQKAELEYKVVTIPSLFLTTFMVITWIIFPVKRKQTYVLCFNFCAWIISFILVLGYGVRNDIKDMSCSNTSQFWAQEFGGYCTFQAIFLFYFSLAGVFWWLIVAFHIYLTVVKQMRFSISNKYALDVCYNIFAWGTPFFFLIVFLGGGGSFGGSANDPLLFCLFDGNSVLSVQYICFFVPIGVACLVGFIFIGFIMNSLHKSALAAAIRGSAKWKRQCRPLLFVIQFFIIFFFIFFFRSESASKSSDIRAAAKIWFGCLLESAGTPEFLAQKCGTGPAKHLTRPIWVGLFFAIGGQGLINFLSWGTQRNNFELWWMACKGKGFGSANLQSDQSNETGAERSQTKGGSKISRRSEKTPKKKDKDGHKKNSPSEVGDAYTLGPLTEEKLEESNKSSKNYESESRPASEINLTDLHGEMSDMA